MAEPNQRGARTRVPGSFVRFVRALASAALAALLVGGSGLWLVQEMEGGERRQAGAPLARALALSFDEMRAHLQDSCASDVRLERLGMELESLVQAASFPRAEDVAHVARSLAASQPDEIWIALERDQRARLLGASVGQPQLPSLEALRAARSEPVASAETPRRVLLACRRPLGSGALWLVRALDPERQQRAGEPRDEGELTWTEREGSRTSATALLEVRGADGSAPLVLSFRHAPDRSPLPITLLLAATALAFGLAGLAGWFAIPAAPEDTVLSELERAAERVAQGDLSSTITLRVGGRADQTFQTFDRMTRELREMRAKLSEAERAAALQDIARRIAHEIKNPLSPIQTAVETLRKAHAKRLPTFDEIFEESTRTVLEEVRRMERIVREFSDFARLPKPRPGALELASLVDDVVALYRPADVQVQVEHGGELPQVRADREQITQVLVNLLQNALDAARESAEPQVVLRVVGAGDGVALHVDDSGPGVAPEAAARIFEPYVTTKANGTGLGLSIVKRIVLDHRGTIEVGRSDLGGARFSVTLGAQGPRDE